MRAVSVAETLASFHGVWHDFLAAYRPDLYRRALRPLGVALPAANAKVEGALERPTPVGSAGASLVLGPDGFFDGARFDPDSLDAYIAAQDGSGSAQEA